MPGAKRVQIIECLDAGFMKEYAGNKSAVANVDGFKIIKDVFR